MLIRQTRSFSWMNRVSSGLLNRSLLRTWWTWRSFCCIYSRTRSRRLKTFYWKFLRVIVHSFIRCSKITSKQTRKISVNSYSVTRCSSTWMMGRAHGSWWINWRNTSYRSMIAGLDSHLSCLESVTSYQVISRMSTSPARSSSVHSDALSLLT